MAMENNLEKPKGKRGGARPGGGRPKGVPNKITSDIKQAILNAFNKVGGADYLAMVATADPKAFCALLGKIVPSEIKGELNHVGGVTVKVVTGIERAPNE